MSAEQPDSGRASDVPTPVTRKEKKRVGFHNVDNTKDPKAGSGSSREDADSVLSPSASPKHIPGSVPPGAPDAQELTRALTKILSQEAEEAERAQQQRDSPQDFTPPEQGHLGVRRPRPALRRNTSYDAPHEREEADRAEQLASQRTLRSITDARERANQLALSVGSYSAPGSRRNSGDMTASFQSLIDDSDALPGRRSRRPTLFANAYDDDTENEKKDTSESTRAPVSTEHLAGGNGGAAAAGGARGQGLATNGTDAADHYVRVEEPHRIPQSEHEGPVDHREAAENIVRSYTRKGKKDLFHQPIHSASPSGTSTPVLQQQYAHDYVPRPRKYRGGVLASLLKLYNDDRGGSGGASTSGFTTPASSAPGTPVMSPRPSPPSSRPASRPGTPKSRPSSGLFSLHRSNNSTSSFALTELMKSSSMFAAPGSSEMADRMADNIKKENAAQTAAHGHSKSKKEQIRITVHIAGIISRHRYLLKLCRALMMYGAPTHRLEEYMIMSARVLEIEGQFLYIPSCMIISFDDSATHTTEVKVVRVPQGIDLGRLRDVHNIYKDVVHDKLGVEEATKRLEEVMGRQPKFSVWFRVFLYGVASASVAPFAFQGRFIDLPFAFVLGCLVGVLQLVFAPNNELYAHVFEVTAAVITSFIARGLGSIKGGELFCFSALAQSSIALILPGYLVLCSSLELQSHNIVAGSVRMVYAMIYTLFLGYGITIGASLYGMMDPNATSAVECTEPLQRGWYFLFVPAFTLCLCLVNQAKWKQTPVMIIMALAGFCVNSYCSEYFRNNVQISNMLGALAVGILANLYSRLGRHFENAWLNFLEWWQFKVLPRFSKRKVHKGSDKWSIPSDPESRPGSPVPEDSDRADRKVGYSLAAAAMLPAIFVQVPSGLAAGGSLLAGIESADQLTNGTNVDSASNSLDGTAFNVLLKVIQVAIGISVGLFMSVLIVYPLGKRRSGVFSF